MNPVNRENLEIGKIYYIESLTTDCHNNIIINKNAIKMAGIFKGLKLCNNWHSIPPWNEAIFDWFSAKFINSYKNIDELYKLNNFTVSLNYQWRFYEVKKYRIQSDMEERVVNLYLKRITKDKWFHYYDIHKSIELIS